MKKRIMWLLLLGLSLTACLGGGADAAPDDVGFSGASADLAAATATDVAAQFLAACLSGDTATALDLLTADIRQAVALTGGYPCSGVPAEAEAAVYWETTASGQTTTVTHTWQRATGATAYLRLLLREEAGVWRIFDAQRDYVQPTPAPRPTPLSPPYTQPPMPRIAPEAPQP
jgi:hypothetical protein